jgi:hypothetical protein
MLSGSGAFPGLVPRARGRRVSRQGKKRLDGDLLLKQIPKAWEFVATEAFVADNATSNIHMVVRHRGTQLKRPEPRQPITVLHLSLDFEKPGAGLDIVIVRPLVVLGSELKISLDEPRVPGKTAARRLESLLVARL